MKSLNKLNHKMVGASLLEALAFIVISMLVLGSGIAMWRTSSAGAKENSAISQVMALQTSYRGYYSSQTTYGAIGADITAIGVTAGIFPTDMKIPTGSTVVTNGWSGPVTVTSQDSTFTISYGKVPSDSCSKIAVMKSDWMSVTVNGTTTIRDNLPITPAQATAQCTGTWAAGNTLTFNSN